MTRSQKLAVWLLALVVGVPFVATVLLVLFYFFHDFGVGVRIRNTGDTVLQSVVVEVDGDRTDVGDIQPGATAEPTVYPKQMAIVFIELTVDGHHRRLETSQARPNEVGYLGVDIADGNLDDLDVDMTFPLPFR